MIEKIKHFFKQRISTPDFLEQTDKKNTIRLASTILLVEVMHADHVVDGRERELLEQILQTSFNLDKQESLEILTLAEEMASNPVSLHEYTSILNENLEHEDKLELIENVWRLILADDVIDRYEEHLVRRISELLYLRQSEFIKAKLKVQEGA